ncbi:glycoside hydrolase family 3 [Auraticoccus sp. F435]|uniref:beta-N-acetylhexosaminidase n=1 Tax=Auraticoccus cholistanensis TaxID=2656650 RepID=A0A6A9V2D8_9ACTN|nr:glycoside hydrolase family 3 [Auraticoccus cholistanensis]
MRPAAPVRSALLAGLVTAALLTACAPDGQTAAPTPQTSAPPAPSPSPTGPAAPTPSPPAATTPASTSSAGTTPAAPPSPSPAPGSCRALAESMTPEEQVGQLVMVGVPATSDLAPQTAQVLAEHHVGSVLLLQNTEAGVDAVARLAEQARDAAGAPEGTTTMLAADQEGGLVQRLQGPGFDTIPSAREQAALSPEELEEAAETWGEQLRRAGVDYDLAPVADLVPEELEQVNEPIGRLDRGYGADPGTVASRVAAFVEGMDEAGVATSVKHFPGLGQVRGNTDFTADVVDRTTTGSDEELAGFRAAVEAEVDSVMVATATYTRLDPDHQAVFSEAVVTDLLRGELSFDGVVVSDDLGVAEAVADVDPERRLLDFLSAGGDLVITADPALTDEMVGGVLDAAEQDRELAAELPGHVTRVLALKAERGLADCDD